MDARVFVTQLNNKFDQATGASVPVININPAAEYGKIVVMMPAMAAFEDTRDLMKQLSMHLQGYCYEDGDHILPLGDPLIITAACAILGKKFLKFRMLKWDRQMKRYFSFVVRP